MIFKRISFKAVPAPGTTVLLALGDPVNKSAVLEHLAGADASVLSSPPCAAFLCVLLDPASVKPGEIKQAEAWLLGSTPSAASGAKKIFLDQRESAWFLFVSGGAVLCAKPEEANELLAAAAEGLFFERELALIEAEVSANWARTEADLPLVNVVGKADIKRMDDLSRTAREIWQRRIKLAKIESALANPGSALTRRGRLLGKRLRIALDIEGRVERLDGQLEVYEYIYEMVSQRMGEYINFQHGFVIEVLIVVLLALELMVMLWEVWRSYR